MQLINSSTRKSRTRKIGAILFSIVLVLIIAAAGILFYWHTHKNAIIKNEIEKAIAKTNDGFYQISYQDMRVNEDSGSLSVINMNVFYDSMQYTLSEQNNETPPMLFHIYIPEIHVTGVKTQQALLKKEIIGRKLEIKNPVIDLEYTYEGQDSIRNIPTKDVYRQVLGNLNKVQVDSILITGAQIKTRNKRSGKLIIDIKDITVALSDVRIDSLAYSDSTRLLFAKNLNIHLDKIAWTSSSNLYHYAANNVLLNSNTRELRINQFLLKPTLNENAFVNAIPTQEDRFDFTFNNITLAGFDISRLADEYVDASSLTIGSATFRVYRDLARPRDKKSRIGLYPHQVLDEVPLLFNIRSLRIPNAFVEYKERNNITRQSGKVQFYNVNASFSNFTNDKKRIAQNNMMRGTIHSSFLNKTPFKTDWIFYLLDQKGRFAVTGDLGPIDATELNSLAEPMGPASIKKGHLNAMEFDLEGSNQNMTGAIKLLYDDLKIALLEKDKGATKTDKKFLTSLLANLLVKNANPAHKDEVRIAKVNYQRDPNRSLFNLCWKTIFDGIRETVGIKRK